MSLFGDPPVPFHWLDQEGASVLSALPALDYNALVGDWPVVVIEGGKAKIKEMKSIPAWWDAHGDLLVKHFEAMGEMYYQRT